MWLARDEIKNGEWGVMYVVSTKKPKMDELGFWVINVREGVRICDRLFHKCTKGIHLRPGECIELKEIIFVPRRMKDLKRASENDAGG